MITQLIWSPSSSLCNDFVSFKHFLFLDFYNFSPQNFRLFYYLVGGKSLANAIVIIVIIVLNGCELLSMLLELSRT